MKAFFRSKWFLVFVLSIPAIPVLYRICFVEWSQASYDKMMHTSGEFAARVLILTLLISPMRMLFPNNAFWKWMRKHRRWVGLVALLHAVLHVVAYVGYHMELSRILADLGKATYLFGWLAFACMLVLGLTSTNGIIKAMGHTNWQRLHRAVYAVALLGCLHWLFKSESGIRVPALVHFVPLFLLETYRFIRWFRTRGPSD